MQDEKETIEIPKPKSTPRITNQDLLFGKPITPMQRLAVMDDSEFEEIVTEWTSEYLSSKYERVRRCGAAGDKGRDIIAWINKTEKKWDNYQCKHYGNKLTPTNFYVELGKLCYYTFSKDFTIPENYFIVSQEGVGTKLGDMLDDSVKLRTALIAHWDTYVKKKITSEGSGEIKLEGKFKDYVENFDFSIVKSIEPHDLIEQHGQTSYHWFHFGGGIKKYRKDTLVPTIADSEKEMRYVKQLLIAYGEEISKEINSIEDLNAHGTYKVHFELQRKNFYSVETLKQFERDNLPPDSKAFEDLKEEIYTAIYAKVLATYENAFKRLISVLDHSGLLTLSSNPLSVTISLHDKQGICHHLVNENKLSWKI